MECPRCGDECDLLTIGYDSYFGSIKQWICKNLDCGWEEGDPEKSVDVDEDKKDGN